MLWEDLEEKMMDMTEMEAEDVDVEVDEGKELYYGRSGSRTQCSRRASPAR